MPIINLVQEWHKKQKNIFCKVRELIKVVYPIHLKYSTNYCEKEDIGFNIFTLSSDYYYRENYHSDIIKAFLDPQESHREGDKFLKVFLELLINSKEQTIISIDDFQDVSIYREKFKIDILIIDNDSNKAIIIENKINNAVDQHRQLPRYYEKVNSEYEVVSIVYLTLNNGKTPQKHDWSTEDLQKINPILYCIPAASSDSSVINLFDHWITPSILKSMQIDASFILRQYGNLIKYQNKNSMDQLSLKSFYEVIVNQEEGLETAQSIKYFVEQLPEYLANRIDEHFRNKIYPFTSIDRYQKRDVVFDGFNWNNQNFKLDIWCGYEGYTVHFWEKNNENNYSLKSEIGSKLSFLENYEPYEGKIGNLRTFFGFKEEEKVIKHITLILSELSNLK